VTEPVRALSLTQPWATLLVHGAKKIESRSWGTSRRGPLWIHAAKGFPAWAKELCGQEPFATALRLIHGTDDPAALPTGAVLGMAHLVACHRIAGTPETLVVKRPHRAEAGRYLIPPAPDTDEHAFGDYTAGRYAWVFEDPAALREPAPAKGAPGLWPWEGTP
jgi:activating signal cointegrator 1